MYHFSDPDVDAAFNAAVTGSERTPLVRVLVDWDGDGYGGETSIDDISGKLAGLSVDRDLVGQLPDELQVVEGIGTASASADLVKGDVDDERLSAVRYWARFNTESPLYGKSRAKRKVQIDLGFLTTNGPQYVRKMTNGSTRNLPVRVADRKANLQVLDDRDRGLRTLVSVPVMAADAPTVGNNSPTKPGLELTWLASFVLFKAGFYLAPPPRAGCLVYLPLHGSAMPFIQQAFYGSPASYVEVNSASVAFQDLRRAITFVPGPFLLATEAVTGADTWVYVKAYPLASSTRVWDTNGRASARVEIWAKITGSEGGNAFTAGLYNIEEDDLQTTEFYADNASGLLKLSVTNNATTIVTGPAYVADGRWHFYGVHFDDAAGTAVFRVDDSSTTVAFTPTTAVPGSVNGWYALLLARASCAELQVTVGQATTDAWQPTAYTPTAVLERLNFGLDGLVPVKKQAWDVLADIAKAIYASVYVDEDGRPTIGPWSRLLTSAALTEQRTVTSATDIIDLAYDDRTDVVRNVITCPYQPVALRSQATVWSLTALVRVPAGGSATVLVDFGAVATATITASGKANTAANGTGTGYTFPQAVNQVIHTIFTRTSETTGALTILNSTGNAVYLVDTAGLAALTLSADLLEQSSGADPPTVRDTTSITAHGEQPLTLEDTPYRQRRGVALGLAWQLLALLRDAQEIVLTDLKIPGDPRLRFYDRIRVKDRWGSELDAAYTIAGIHDEVGADGGYDQSLVARPARSQLLLGTSALGSTLIGETR